MCVISATVAGSAAMAAAANVSLAAAAVGGAVSAYGAYSQGQQAKAMAEYQSDVAERNAKISEMQAQDAITRGKQDKSALQQKFNQMRGTGRAAMGGSGLLLDDPDSSGMDWQTDLVDRRQFDEQTIDVNAKKEAWAYKVQGANATAQAGAYRASASNAATQGLMSAGGSLLSSAGTVAGRYYRFNNSQASGYVY